MCQSWRTVNLYQTLFDPDAHGIPLADVRVREATDADLDACGALQARREGGLVTQWAERLRRSRLDEGRQVFVAAQGERVVGYAMVGWLEPIAQGGRNAPDGWYLSGIAVAPEFRRRGLGRVLTQARCDWVWARADEVFCVASRANRASVAMHEGLGFFEVTRDFLVPSALFGAGDGILLSAQAYRRRVLRFDRAAVSA